MPHQVQKHVIFVTKQVLTTSMVQKRAHDRKHLLTLTKHMMKLKKTRMNLTKLRKKEVKPNKAKMGKKGWKEGNEKKTKT